MLQLKKDEVTAAILELSEILKDQAVITLINDESITLVTRPELKDELQKLEKEELAKEFSKGAIETLALIAYKGPIGKSDIDYIRGVNSQFMLRNLVMRGMIEKQAGGKGYNITTDALRFLGVTNREDLPQFNEFFTEIEKRLPVDESDISNSHDPVIQTELDN
jgi:segregation and condensation protein B